MKSIVIKRDGRKEKYNEDKILKSIRKAGNNIVPEDIEEKILDALGNSIETSNLTVDSIEELIEQELSYYNFGQVADAHRSYRMERTRIRDDKSELMKIIGKIAVETDRDE